MSPVKEQTGPDPARRDVPTVPPPVAAARPTEDMGLLRLGRGLVWSDLVRQIEEEHVIRLQLRAAAETGDPVGEAA